MREDNKEETTQLSLVRQPRRRGKKRQCGKENGSWADGGRWGKGGGVGWGGGGQVRQQICEVSKKTRGGEKQPTLSEPTLSAAVGLRACAQSYRSSIITPVPFIVKATNCPRHRTAQHRYCSALRNFSSLPCLQAPRDLDGSASCLVLLPLVAGRIYLRLVFQLVETSS